MFKTLIDIIAAPHAAFAAIRQKPAVLLPMLVVLGAVASIQLGFFFTVDKEFFVDQMVEQALAANPQAPENAIRANYANLSPRSLAGISAGSAIVILTLVTALIAAYLNLMAKLGYADIGFKAWFALCWWTAIPTVFVALSAWVVILGSANGQIRLADLNPLSLDALLFHTRGPWANLLGNLSVVSFWSMALMVLGYRQWTQAGMAKAASIALMPYVLIYGIWALTIAL